MVPLVSIITPCGPRHADHARLAAASVAWQSLAHLCEHIIACDGGADVGPMANVTILPSDGERRGPAHTRNRALAAARGQFILPLDADDYLLPHAVEVLLREYGRGQFGYVYADAYTEERDGRFILRPAPDYVQNHMAHHNIHVVTALTPTKHWRAVGGWDEGVDAWEDWSGHLRLAMAGICGHRLPQPIFTYRVYEGNRMTQFYGGAPELMEKVLVRYRNKEGRIPMATCCGGDADLAALAQNAVAGASGAPAAAMEGGKVRVEYIGDDRGAQTWEYPFGHTIRLGNNTIDRYRDVTPEQADWLRSIGVPIRVVPVFDGPEAPEPLPILKPTDVLTPDAQTKVLRPKRAAQ
jgi:glycosyl transferase family 2